LSDGVIWLHLRKNDKGMTLIELIISMAISAIILSLIIIIISSASRIFRRTNDEVNLQLEAQTTINQLSNLSMEASKIVHIDPPPSSFEEKYIITCVGKSYAVLFSKTEKKLYLMKGINDSDVITKTYTDAGNLMAEYVDIFTITGVKKVTINITFVLGDDTYSVSKKVNLRNAN